MLGLVYLDAGERAKASSQYSYALDLKPGYYAAMIGPGALYRAEGNGRARRSWSRRRSRRGRTTSRCARCWAS